MAGTVMSSGSRQQSQRRSCRLHSPQSTATAWRRLRRPPVTHVLRRSLPAEPWMGVFVPQQVRPACLQRGSQSQTAQLRVVPARHRQGLGWWRCMLRGRRRDRSNSATPATLSPPMQLQTQRQSIPRLRHAPWQRRRSAAVQSAAVCSRSQAPLPASQSRGRWHGRCRPAVRLGQGRRLCGRRVTIWEQQAERREVIAQSSPSAVRPGHLRRRRWELCTLRARRTARLRRRP